MRACADLAARAERAAGLRGHQRGRRAAGPGTRAPDPDHHPQGRQGGHHPAGAANRPGDRPGRWRAHRRAGVCGRGRPPAGPARRRADRPQGRPPRRDRQSGHASQAEACVHHRSWMPGSRCATCKRPPRTPTQERRSGTTGPEAAWTGTPLVSSPPTSQALPGNRRISREKLCLVVAAARQSADANHHSAVTYRDLSANANRPIARATARCRSRCWPPGSAHCVPAG